MGFFLKLTPFIINDFPQFLIKYDSPKVPDCGNAKFPYNKMRIVHCPFYCKKDQFSSVFVFVCFSFWFLCECVSVHGGCVCVCVVGVCVWGVYVCVFVCFFVHNVCTNYIWVPTGGFLTEGHWHLSCNMLEHVEYFLLWWWLIFCVIIIYDLVIRVSEKVPV